MRVVCFVCTGFWEHPSLLKRKPINFCDLRDRCHISIPIGNQAAAKKAGATLWLNRYWPFWKISWEGLERATEVQKVEDVVSESWTALRMTAQYYMDLGSLAFDTDTARSYLNTLRQSGAHLQEQTSGRN